MPKTQVWKPDDGFARKKTPDKEKRKENVAALSRLKAQRLNRDARTKKASETSATRASEPPKAISQRTRAPKPSSQPTDRSDQAAHDSPQKPIKPQTDAKSPSSRKAERRRRWLENNTIKEADYQTGDQYIAKQIREQTPMVFQGYGKTFRCQVTRLWKYNLNVLIDDKQRTLSKLSVACYYKQQDAEDIEAVIRVDESIVKQKLEPIVPRKDRYPLKNTILLESRNHKTPIEIALRTGHTFNGYVRWFTPYDIGLRLSNGVKVHLFRHAIYQVRSDLT